jgi:hypothetical protein
MESASGCLQQAARFEKDPPLCRETARRELPEVVSVMKEATNGWHLVAPTFTHLEFKCDKHVKIIM